jgi:putative heme degradation protein
VANKIDEELFGFFICGPPTTANQRPLYQHSNSHDVQMSPPTLVDIIESGSWTARGIIHFNANSQMVQIVYEMVYNRLFYMWASNDSQSAPVISTLEFSRCSNEPPYAAHTDVSSIGLVDIIESGSWTARGIIHFNANSQMVQIVYGLLTISQ